jgi:hypothetical protein
MGTCKDKNVNTHNYEVTNDFVCLWKMACVRNKNAVYNKLRSFIFWHCFPAIRIQLCNIKWCRKILYCCFTEMEALLLIFVSYYKHKNKLDKINKIQFAQNIITNQWKISHKMELNSRMNIVIYIQQDATLHSLFFWKLLYVFRVIDRYCYLTL